MKKKLIELLNKYDSDVIAYAVSQNQRAMKDIEKALQSTDESSKYELDNVTWLKYKEILDDSVTDYIYKQDKGIIAIYDNVGLDEVLCAYAHIYVDECIIPQIPQNLQSYFNKDDFINDYVVDVDPEVLGGKYRRVVVLGNEYHIIYN